MLHLSVSFALLTSLVAIQWCIMDALLDKNSGIGFEARSSGGLDFPLHEIPLNQLCDCIRCNETFCSFIDGP